MRLKVRDFQVEYGGGFLRVRSVGASDAKLPTLVFLHEGLGSIGQWRDFPDRLSASTGLCAVVFDRPGFGGSSPLDRPRDGRYLQREDLGSLLAVLDHLGVVSPVLVGHSDGGTLALLWAAAYPERTLGVIVEAAHVFVEPRTLQGIRAAVEAFDEGGLLEGLSRYHGEKTAPMFRRWADDWLAPEFSRWNVEGSLTGVRAPVLVVQGAEDQYGTLDQVESIRSRVSGPAQTLIVPGCGHVPHREAEKAVLEAMARFVAELQKG